MKMKKWLKCLLMVMALMMAVNVGTASTTLTAAAKAKTATKTKKTKKAEAALKVKDVFCSKNLQYKVTFLKGKKGTAMLIGTKSKNVTSVSVPQTVTVGKYTLQVTAIGKNAFQNCKKLTKVDIKSTAITTIGAGAFQNCKKLTKVTIESTKLKSVGKNALTGISKDAVVTVPTKNDKSYKKLLQKVTVQIKEQKKTTAKSTAVKAAEQAKAAPETEAAKTTSVTEADPSAKEAAGVAKTVETALAEKNTSTTQSAPAKTADVKSAPAETSAAPTASQPKGQTAPQTEGQTAPQTERQAAPQTERQAAPQTERQTAPQTEARTVTQTEATCGKKHLGLVVVESVAPTCTETGLSSYEYCTVCGYRTTPIVLSALGHDFVRYAEIAPTCTKAGQGSYERCKVCGYQTTPAVLPALGHDLVHHAAVVSTCTREGQTAYDTCNRCDYATTPKSVAKTAHVLETVQGKNATCTSGGWTTYQFCKVCGTNVGYQYLSPLGHSYGAWTVAEEPGCTTTGTEESSCTRCGARRTRTTAARGHVYGQQEQEHIDGNNCYDRIVYHCTVCGYRKVANSVAHRTDFMVHEADIAPTCTTSGKTNRSICPYCGLENYAYVKPLGHNFCTEEITEEPTCAKEGQTYRKCSRCDEKTAVRTIPRKDHTWTTKKTAATCTTDGFDGKECTVCGKQEGTTVRATGHSYTVADVVSPSCGKDGYKKEKCADCDAVRMTTLPALTEHNWVSHAAKQATCTEDGYTAYVQCSRCKAYQDGKAPEKLASKGGHQWNDAAPVSIANFVGGAADDGKCQMTEFVKCRNCGTFKVVPGRGHIPGNQECGYEKAKQNHTESGYIQWTVFLSEKSWSSIPAGFESNCYHTTVWMAGKMYHAYIPARRSSVSFAAPGLSEAGFAGWQQVAATSADTVQNQGTPVSGPFGPESAGKTYVAVFN